MITSKDIKYLCNYVECNLPNQSNISSIAYLDFVEPNKGEIIRKNRNIAIDAILDNKVEEYIDNISSVWPENISEFELNTISPKFLSYTLRAIRYKTIDEIYNAVSILLEKLTKNSNTLKISDDYTNSSLKISNNIHYLSNKICHKSRYGYANSIIIGRNCKKYFLNMQSFQIVNHYTKLGELNGVNVILNNIIDPDKIIVCKVSDNTETGINLVNNLKDLTYSLGETPGSFDLRYESFNII